MKLFTKMYQYRNVIRNVCIFLLLSIVIVNASWYQTHNSEKVRSGSVKITEEDISLPLVFPDKKETVCLTIVPQYAGMQQIRLAYTLNDATAYDRNWKLVLKLWDEHGNLQAKKTVSQKSLKKEKKLILSLQKNEDGVLSMSSVLQKGKAYRLEIRIHKKSTVLETPVVLYLTKQKLKESSQTYKRNSQGADSELPGSLKILYQYEYNDYETIARMMGWLLLILLVMVFEPAMRSCNYIETEKTELKTRISVRWRSALSWCLTPLPAIWFLQTVGAGAGFSFLLPVEYWAANLLIFYILLLLLTLFIGRRRAQEVFLILFFFTALIFYFVYQFRGRAISLFDIYGIRTATAVAEGYTLTISGELGLQIVRYIACVLILLVLRGENLKKQHGRKHILIKSAGRIGTACLILCTGVLLSKNTQFEEKLFSRYNLSEGDFWRLDETYRDKGVAFTLLGEAQFLRIEKPENYSIKHVRQILSRFETTSQVNEEIQKRGTGIPENERDSIVPENLIIIMNESFADLGVLGTVDASAPLIPEWHMLSENFSSGYVHVQIYGGGTCDSEYEVLTGNTKLFLPKNGIAYEQNCQSPEYGLTSLLKSLGYYTVAVHPGNPISWNRQDVYENMGFDEFIHNDNWSSDHQEKIRSFVSDQAMYEFLFDQYLNKPKGQKRFTFGVTIQNHGGFDNYEKYGLEPEIALNYDQPYASDAYYLTLLNESSRAFLEFTEKFQTLDQNTMIVMFGDHQANLTNDFLTEVIGKPVSEMSNIEKNLRYTVPYVIWTNYPLEKENDEMSSSFFGAYIMKRAGLPISPYQSFLLELKEKLPVLGVGETFRSSEGNWYALESLPKDCRELLNEYQILQYNRTADRGEMLKEAFMIQTDISSEDASG